MSWSSVGITTSQDDTVGKGIIATAPPRRLRQEGGGSEENPRDGY